MNSPVLFQYLKKYQQDPGSRVFAPLAEAYRKAGLVDEAIEIAREGLRSHPAFTGGRVALARALFDKKQYDEVATELSKVVRDAPDNLVAQRLLAESCLMLGRVAEALGAYKMLLYFSPNDAETARIVAELEVEAYQGGALVLRTDSKLEAVPSFDIRPAQGAFEADPALIRSRRNQRIEKLQSLLQRVERYRVNHS